MTQRLKLHDHVSWNTPQGMTRGEIVRVITNRTTFAGHTVAASEDDPHYEVASEKTGKHAVHRGDGLQLIKH
jgi:Hypervirulence associated proteins TUDOR domain